MQAKVLRCELKVEGLFCSSCELRIEQALYKLDGIINVEASYSGSVVRIAYDQDVIQLPEIVALLRQRIIGLNLYRDIRGLRSIWSAGLAKSPHLSTRCWA